jgi:tRNA(fMet)-specific endonuclease VapC
VIGPPCILDTSIASLLLRKDSRAAYYAPNLIGFRQTLSFQTVAEMREGALLAGWGAKRQAELEEFLRSFVVAPFSDAVASEWARIRAAGGKSGQRLEAGDAWVAATAAALNAPLLTHDGDFNEKSCPGVQIIRYLDSGERD